MQTTTSRASVATAMPPLNLGETDLAAPHLDTLTAGIAAWDRIQTASKLLREDWRVVGEALLVGRRLHPSNIAFSRWCKENGFDMAPSVRSNAMWLAENWSLVLQSLQDGDSHPTNIRTAYNAALAETAEPEDEDEDEDEPTTAPEPAPLQNPAEEPAQPAKPATAAQPANAPGEEDDEQVPAESIFDRKPTERELLLVRAARLVDIPTKPERSGTFAFDSMFTSLHSDMMLAVAKDALLDEVQAGADPKSAVSKGVAAIRAKGAEMREQVCDFITKLEDEGAKNFLRRARGNPILNSKERRVSAMLAHAFSDTSATAERTKAIEMLEALKSKG